MAAGRPPGRGRAALRGGPRRRRGAVPGAGHRHPGGQGLHVHEHGLGGGGPATRAVTAPLSLIVTAFAPGDRRAPGAHPAAPHRRGRDRAAAGRPRAAARTGWAARRWRRSIGRLGERAARPRRPGAARGLLRRGPGAERRGPPARLPRPLRRRAAGDAAGDGLRRRHRAGGGPVDARPATRCAALFAEELGAVLQVRGRDAGAVVATLERRGPRAAASHRVGAAGRRRSAWCFARRRRALLDGLARRAARRLVRDHPPPCRRCATTPPAPTRSRRAACDAGDPGLHVHLTFDPGQDVAAPFVARGARPRVAILREQGVNGQVEMAAAFDRAGFEAVDVHMSDLLAGPHLAGRLPRPGRLRRLLLRRRAGRGRGLGQVDPLQRPGARRASSGSFAARGHLRAGRLQRLPDALQPARAHPRRRAPGRASCATAREQFEARLLAGRGAGEPVGPARAAWPARGSPSPWRTARGGPSSRRARSGAALEARGWWRRASSTTAAAPTEHYPENPNGSPGGHHRRHHARRPGHHPHAPPRARVPRGAALLATRRHGRGRALDAALPQRPRLGGVTGVAAGGRGARTAFSALPGPDRRARTSP